ncbi:unnamed protein product [Penicillium salamii]|uniref:Uncharacterized protein n=1 Tax=Penicillium salamii TaxID=1612424 RepID=A0A9W4IXU9_9EURO|nr:unnamed protein product [Penicillium salamii]CAG8263223.1 unnamed protein product [Penicillium salamii]CAG8317909.1 unnamed protein product [Penicillium salamii]CAG8367092.1 unnamed protein product [Penicillium salamii]CAG8391195.1 unnamed protein product [Penicillium salamii]
MSLKRKASFTALPNSPLVPAPSEWNMALDGNTHLHSRTRKRFRDDRPCENVIYQNTLRWIYSAQKQQQPQATTENDTMDSEPTIEPEVVDPRQQTLHHFFKTPQQSPTFRPSRQALAPRANETALAEEESLRYRAFNQLNGAGSASASEGNSPGYTQTCADGDMDMDMDVDCASGSDMSNQTPNTWMSGTAWA